MNSTDPWEAQLASWQPRPPSAALKQRLFAAPPPAPSASRRVVPSAGWLTWLTPAFGTALLVGSMVLHPAGPVRLTADTTHALGSVTYLTAGRHSAQNALPTSGFSWTNGAFTPPTNIARGAWY